MQVQVSILRDASIPIEVVGTASVLQQSREISRVVQDRYLVSPEAVTIVLSDAIFPGDVCEVLLVGAALEGWRVPENPKRVFARSGIDDEGV